MRFALSFFLSCLLWASVQCHQPIVLSGRLAEQLAALGYDDSEQRMSGIIPGTKWCGTGDAAENEKDLGYFEETDKCCRAHDLCDDIIETGEKKHGLINNSEYTKLNCTCDDEFLECLKKADEMISSAVADGYFNELEQQCFVYDYPLTFECKATTFFTGVCKDWRLKERDTTKPQIYQYVPVKNYK